LAVKLENMQLEILVKNQIIVLSLKKGKKIIGQSEFSEKNSLSRDLLIQINKLLQENKLTAKMIKKVSVQTEISKAYTSYRIAEAVAKAFNTFAQAV